MKRQPVCAKCGRELTTEINGVQAIYYEKYDQGGIRPYKVHASDLWECPECEYSILVGFANKATYSNGDEEDFEEYVETLLESKISTVKVRTWRVDDDGSYGLT